MNLGSNPESLRPAYLERKENRMGDEIRRKRCVKEWKRVVPKGIKKKEKRKENGSIVAEEKINETK